jgi:DNA-directed RNA polymerase specialized sigma subunit
MNTKYDDSSAVNAEDIDNSYVDASFATWRNNFLANPENRAVYEQLAHEKEIWLQLQEARVQAGLTQHQVAARMGVSQAQVARLEKHGYNGYALRSLQRYVEALDGDYEVTVSIRKRTPQPPETRKVRESA